MISGVAPSFNPSGVELHYHYSTMDVTMDIGLGCLRHQDEAKKPGNLRHQDEAKKPGDLRHQDEAKKPGDLRHQDDAKKPEAFNSNIPGDIRGRGLSSSFNPGRG